MIAACLSALSSVDPARLAHTLGTSPLRRVDHSQGGNVALAGWSEPGTSRSAIARYGGLTVVFDGWLANRADLLRQLDLAPDTPAALLYSHALKTCGEKADTMCDGHYAAIATDGETLRLARSPLAAPPLHWRRCASLVAAGSLLRSLEIPACGALGELDTELQAAALAGDQNYAARGWYAETHRVPLGQAILVRPDQGRAESVWRYPGLNIADTPDGNHVGAIRTLLDRAVTSAIEGHASVALSLSGGLDSGLVADSALRSADDLPGERALKAWCYAPEKGAATAPPGDWVTDEAQAAEAFAQFHEGSIELEIVRAEGTDFRAPLDNLLAISRCAPREMALVYQLDRCMARAAAAGCTVMLGGDEGNSTISASGSWAYRHWFRSLQWRRLAKELRLRQNDRRPLWRRLASLVLRPMMPSRRDAKATDRYFADLGIARGARQSLGLDDSRWLRHQFASKPRPLDPRETAELLAAEDDLGRSDALKALEARHGLPYRDPTLTHALAEACLSLPASAFLKGGETRHLARELARGVMPEEQRLRQLPEFGPADARARILRARPQLLAELELMAQHPEIPRAIDPIAMAKRLRSLDGKAELTLSDQAFCSAGLPAAIAAGRMIARSSGSNSI